MKTATHGNPIFLRSTGPGAGGIATLVLDGGGLISRLQPLFHAKQPLLDTPFNKLVYGRIVDRFGAMIDEVIVTILDAKETATGHEQIELSCHGSEGAVRAVEDALLSAGFARGRGTELLERGHLNGKLSLVALEARLALAGAVTARQAEFLLGHAEFQQRWEKLGFEMAFGMRSRDMAWREPLYNAAREAAAKARGGVALLGRHAVAILGPVNAGKSTLANRLARADRHIVSAEPGTTRDRLDTPLEIRGVNVVLADTAGLRDGAEGVEREGQRRAQLAADEAALRLVVLDGSQAPSEADVAMVERAAARGPLLLVLNKHDLGVHEEAAGLGFVAGTEPISISAQSGEGVEALEAGIERALLGEIAPVAGDPFSRRQASLLERMEAGLKEGVEAGEILRWLRHLVGTRPDAEQLQAIVENRI